MVRGDVVAEAWAALRTDVTRFGDSCFVSNMAMGALRRHGADLPPAIAAVVGSPEFEPARRADCLVATNTLQLFLLFFELSDAHGLDPVPLLRSLRGPALHQALVAVHVIWGLAGQKVRRPTISRALYEAFQALVAINPDWIGDRNALSAAVSGGSLVFTDDAADLLSRPDSGHVNG